MAAKIGVVMIQKGQPVKQWQCPHCGHIEYTSIYETESPFCPACIGNEQAYILKREDNLFIDRKL